MFVYNQLWEFLRIFVNSDRFTLNSEFERIYIIYIRIAKSFISKLHMENLQHGLKIENLIAYSI